MSKSLVQRSVQEKVSITLIAVLAILAALSYATLQRVVAPAFDRLETTEARTNLVRARNAIQNDLQNLSAIAGDWALWDDAYDFVLGEYPAFEDSNLDRPTLTNLNLNLLAIYDADHELVWGQAESEGIPVELGSLQVLNDGTASAEYLITHSDPAGQTNGLLSTGIGPLMISSWPIVRSDGSGPIAGTLIMGQALDDARLAALRQRTEVAIDWVRLDSQAGDELRYEVPLNMSGSGSIVQEVGNDAIVSSGLMTDLFDTPLIVLEVSTPRNISALGRSTVNGALLFLAVAGTTVAIVTGLLLRYIIVLPLEALTGQISEIRRSGDLSRRLKSQRDDEIGSLANQFDKLNEEVHDARMLVLDQSFKAGKADAAAEVLHNIRNAMTPLINGIDRIGKSFRKSQTLRVEQATEELADADCPEGRREKLLMYLNSAFVHMKSTNDEAIESLNVARRQAGQVEAILADQERHAKVAPIVEDFDLGKVIEEAVLVLPKEDESDISLNLQEEISAYRVRGHRVGVLQVLGNVILNAYESIQRCEADEGRIGVSATTETLADVPVIKLTISDTGGGFDENVGEKLFQRGFSSKDGHMSGLGLHWCANALAGMGGRIQAESDGPGRGAEIHVLLPAAQGG